MPRKKKKFKQDPAQLVQSFSKNLLGLKFMQRAQKANEKDPIDLSYDDYEDEDEDEEEDGDGDENGVKTQNTNDTSLPSDGSPIKKLKGKRKCVIHPSYQFCEKLKFGRLSFKGMNADIEMLMHTFESVGGGNLNFSGVSSVSQKRPADDDWDED